MMPVPYTEKPQAGEEGYFLVGLAVVCFLLLLILGVAAPRVAKQLEREREVESEHRAQEYVRAIQLYYRKNGRYPASMDQLSGSSGSGFSSALNVKYLRQKYKDPLTGDEYRLIHQGEAKTEVKGFFGEPLQGIAGGNLGSAAGSVSNLNGTPGPLSGGAQGQSSGLGGASQGFSLGNSTSGGAGGLGSGSQTFGPSSTFGSAGSSFGSSASGASGGNAPASGNGGTGTPGSGGTGTGAGSEGSTSATSFQGSKGAIVGVGSNAKGHGLVEWNGSENIEQWEFLYDPRVESMKAKVSLFGGSPAASGSGSLGGGFKPVDGSTGMGFGQSGGASGSSGTGGFGSGSSPGFGAGPGLGTPGASSGGAGTQGGSGGSQTPAPQP